MYHVRVSSKHTLCIYIARYFISVTYLFIISELLPMCDCNCLLNNIEIKIII